MATTAGYDLQTSSSYSWDGLQRGAKPYTVIQHTISGAGLLRFERERFRVLPGQTMILTFPHDHRYWVEDDGRWEFFWISMHGQEALRVHRNILAAGGPVQTLPASAVEHLAACALRMVEATPATPGAVSALAYEALMALHDGAAGAAEAKGQDRVGQALSLIHDRRGRRAPVARLAEAAGYTRAHFTRRFAAKLGEPPAQFQRKQRLREAANALAANRRLTVKEAASAAGFVDQSHFAKAFRALFGLSPRQYRDRESA